MSTMIENINSIVATKNELGNILDENGVARPNTFTEYPPLLRSIIQNSSYGADLEERVEELETDVNTIEQNLTYYATQSYVADYVATYGGGDLSAYVTKTELYNAGYISSIPSYYITDSELSSYGYATETYVVNYVEEHSGGGGVIDEDIIPKENNTYTLGTSEYKYNTSYVFDSYVCNLRGINNGSTLCIEGYANGDYSPTISIVGPIVMPGSQNKQVSLGTGLQQFKDAYSYKYYVGDEGEIHDIFTTYAYVVDYVNTHSGGGGVIDENIIPKENDTYTLGNNNYKYQKVHTNNLNGGSNLNIYLNEGRKYIISSAGLNASLDNSRDLGAEQYKWKSTYSYNYYLGGEEAEIRTVFPTYAYVVDYVDQHGGGGGSEVTYTYLSTYYPTKTAVNAMFSYDSSTGTLTITTLS